MQSHYQRLTDPQWEIIAPYLPTQRKRKHSLREIVDAVLWYLRLGSQWRNITLEGAPKWQLVYYYFSKWSQDGTLEKLNWALNKKERQRVGKEETPSMLSIDSQSVRIAAFVSKETGIDGNKKINGRKRHIITDTLGLVWGVVVHAANKADGVMGQEVVAPLQGYLSRMEKILGDAAYEKSFIDWVAENMLGVEVEISSKAEGKEGFKPVKWRWVTERTFGIFNFFRRLAKDYEKSAQSAQSWVLWQNCQVILNRIS